MSVDIKWEAITSGPKGEALAETIRQFIHDKFQEVTLPGFIRSVQVHSFEFGSTSPRLEIVDIGDPLPEFYEDEDEEEDEEEQDGDGNEDDGGGGEGEWENEGDGEVVGDMKSKSDRETGLTPTRRRGGRGGGDILGPTPSTTTTTTTTITTSSKTNTSTQPSLPPSLSVPLQHHHHHHHPPPPPPSSSNNLHPQPQPVTQPQQRPRPQFNLSDYHQPLGSPFPRSTTPGIPGGTSNLGYFHLPLGGGLSGPIQTPLAAIASGSTNLAVESWSRGVEGDEYRHRQQQQQPQPQPQPQQPTSRRDVIRSLQDSAEERDGNLFSVGSPAAGHAGAITATPRTDHGHTHPATNSPYVQSPADVFTPQQPSQSLPKPYQISTPTPTPKTHAEQPISPTEPPSNPTRDPSDLQVIAHVDYTGDIRLTLTAEILLDYPMPSFVSIPLKLSITGMTFDGVAILAWLRKNLYFCFLGEEDAALVVGKAGLGDDDDDDRDVDGRDSFDRSGEAVEDTRRGGDGGGDACKREGRDGKMVGRLLEEIRVESEIGRKENGKQVLKNVGKVEKFVLEQVRRIFEEEFVFPSFWTFLV